MNHAGLIENYAAGPRQLREAVAGMTDEQADATPVPGKWSTRAVICHLADYEGIYLDRIKRAIAEDEPTLFAGNADALAARLAYQQRNIEDELQLIESIRKHLTPVLRSLSPEGFQRIAHHSTNGPLTVEQLLADVVAHMPHHIHFIHAKRMALA